MHFACLVKTLPVHSTRKTSRMKYISMAKAQLIYHLLLSILYRRNQNLIGKVNLISDFQADV